MTKTRTTFLRVAMLLAALGLLASACGDHPHTYQTLKGVDGINIIDTNHYIENGEAIGRVDVINEGGTPQTDIDAIKICIAYRDTSEVDHIECRTIIGVSTIYPGASFKVIGDYPVMEDGILETTVDFFYTTKTPGGGGQLEYMGPCDYHDADGLNLDPATEGCPAGLPVP